mmetsp:Transcript_12717/g.48763  ORF Transcript_12717/g.48763 Transcript_12717/m.48763 type:complete len:328 (-) Transcript_12717:214-1197(-)
MRRANSQAPARPLPPVIAPTLTLTFRGAMKAIGATTPPPTGGPWPGQSCLVCLPGQQLPAVPWQRSSRGHAKPLFGCSGRQKRSVLLLRRSTKVGCGLHTDFRRRLHSQLPALRHWWKRSPHRHGLCCPKVARSRRFFPPLAGLRRGSCGVMQSPCCWHWPGTAARPCCSSHKMQLRMQLPLHRRRQRVQVIRTQARQPTTKRQSHHRRCCGWACACTRFGSRWSRFWVRCIGLGRRFDLRLAVRLRPAFLPIQLRRDARSVASQALTCRPSREQPSPSSTERQRGRAVSRAGDRVAARRAPTRRPLRALHRSGGGLRPCQQPQRRL